MKVNCISCGHELDLGDCYDDYEGVAKCWVCNSLLDIKSVEGQIKSVAFGATPLRARRAHKPVASALADRNADSALQAGERI